MFITTCNKLELYISRPEWSFLFKRDGFFPHQGFDFEMRRYRESKTKALNVRIFSNDWSLHKDIIFSEAT